LFDPSKRQKLLSGLKKKPLQEVLGKKVIKVNASDGHKFILSDGTWLLLRLSGTEPKLRVYSETPSKKKSLEYLKFGKKYAFDIMK
jgi:phosphomannomutase